MGQQPEREKEERHSRFTEEETSPDVARHGQTWLDVAGRGWMWLDVAGHAWLMGQNP